jgi:hypothetical protein
MGMMLKKLVVIGTLAALFLIPMMTQSADAVSREDQVLFINASDKGDTLRADVDNSFLEPQYSIRRDAYYHVPFTNSEYIERQDEILQNLSKIMQG